MGHGEISEICCWVILIRLNWLVKVLLDFFLPPKNFFLQEKDSNFVSTLILFWPFFNFHIKLKGSPTHVSGVLSFAFSSNIPVISSKIKKLTPRKAKTLTERKFLVSHIKTQDLRLHLIFLILSYTIHWFKQPSLSSHLSL